MTGSSKAKTAGKAAGGAGKGAKTAVDAWEKEGDREDQDYYYIPGSPERDHEEVHSGNRGEKPRKS